MSNIEYFTQLVVRAEAAQKVASDTLEKSNTDYANVVNRHATKHAEAEKLIADVRSGALDETVAALRDKVLTADIADLNVLLTEAHRRVDAADQALKDAESNLARARDQLATRENSAKAQALESAVADLEAKLLRALQERRLALGVTESGFFRVWKPSRDLLDAIQSTR